jgi:hypothetical protein
VQQPSFGNVRRGQLRLHLPDAPGTQPQAHSTGLTGAQSVSKLEFDREYFFRVLRSGTPVISAFSKHVDNPLDERICHAII